MMFINSIFLPKNLPDQTMPEGVSGKIGDFSHLFSNVFRIVKDEQNNTVPFQLAELSAENTTETQSQLLNISLLSNKKLSLDNQNISSIIAAFLTKFNPSGIKGQSVNADKTEIKNNIPKYFSLNKSDFLSEIKNVVDDLKKADAKNLDNVSIVLIADGQSIQINPLLTNTSKLENWVLEQLETNNDFEIIVKSGSQKLAVDVEPVKTETIRTNNPVEVISETSNIENDTAEVLKSSENNVESGIKLNFTRDLKSEVEPQLEGLKTTSTNQNNLSVPKIDNTEKSSENNKTQTVKTDNPKITIDKTVTANVDPKENAAAELLNETKITDVSKVSVTKTIVEKNVPQNDSVKNPVVDLKINGDKKISDTIKDLNVIKNTEPVVKEQIKSENKINIKSNHKLSSVSVNKNDLQEKIEMSDLLEKTNVKEVEVKVQSTEGEQVKGKVQAQVQEKIQYTISGQEKVQIKEQVQVKYHEDGQVKGKVQVQVQQELFVDSNVSESENSVTSKTEQVKILNNVQPVVKEKVNIIPEKEAPAVKNISVENEVVKTKTTKVEIPESKKEIAVDAKINNVKSENKTEVKTVFSNEAETIIDEVSEELFDNKTVKESNTVNLKDNSPLKSKTAETNKTFSDAEAGDNVENQNSTTKEKAVFENLKTSVKELVNKEVKTDKLNKPQVKNIDTTQSENQNTKIDFTQRRVYSQIPQVEIFTKESEEINIKPLEEPVKTTPNQTELKPKNEKQVWVKVSLEKNENELSSDSKKSTVHQNKITIDANDKGQHKSFEQNNFAEKDTQDHSKQKPQIIEAESSAANDVKNVNHNQNTSSQQDLSVSLKPEMKTEQTHFKSTLNAEETKFNSRAAEMVEKIKVISSGEVVKEVYKVFESGEKQSIVLRLVPKELGNVKVVLDTINNALTAKVEVESEAVGNLLRNNVDQLKQNLVQNGVNVNSISISYHQSEQKQHGFNQQKRRNSTYQQNIETEDIDETILAKKMGYNTYEYLA